LIIKVKEKNTASPRAYSSF